MSKQDAEDPPLDLKIAKRLFEMRTVLIHGEVTQPHGSRRHRPIARALRRVG